MKVIDLLNKIANGEEVPKEVIWNKKEYFYSKNKIYVNKKDEPLIYDLLPSGGNLNDEVEIIEEDEDIEKLKIEQDGSTYYIKNEHGTKCYLTKHSYLIADKVNELIDEVKKLKGKYE